MSALLDSLEYCKAWLSLNVFNCQDQLIYCLVMKAGVFLCFLLLIASIHGEALQLFSVSSSSSSIINPSGSVRGGTIIYIRGLGFSASAADNTVFVGTYPCKIPADGATETTLACVTSDTNQDGDIYNLPIIVTSNGQTQSLTNEQGCFSYLNSRTPLLQGLFPASAVAGSLVHFLGIHRISNLGDGQRDMGEVVSMLIGDTQCGRFDIIEGPINPNWGAFISCKQALLQEAGKYQVSELLIPGYSNPESHLRRSSFLQENYHFAVLPAITSLSAHMGAAAGNRITISGSGFSTKPSILSVDVDGTDCSVISSTLTSITCDIKPYNSSISTRLATDSTAQKNGYISGTGLKYQLYDTSKLPNSSPENLRLAIQNKATTITLLESGIKGEIKSGGEIIQSYVGEAFTGYFTAPVTGSYVFRGVADDAFILYLSNTHGSTELTTPFSIKSNSYQSYNNFYTFYTATAEGKVTLQAGNSYYLEVYHINYGGSGSLKVGVQIPNSDDTLTWQTHAVHKLDLTFTNDPQIIDFKQTGGTGGQINLTTTTKVLGQPSIIEGAVIGFQATEAEFTAALNSLSIFNGYQISVKRTTLDSSGVSTTDPTLINSIVWRVSIPIMRTTTAIKTLVVPKFIAYTGTQTFTSTTIQPHGPLISGSFTMQISGNPLSASGTTALRYGISAGDLQAAIRAIPALKYTEVQLLSSSLPNTYGSTWLISYYGYNGPVPLPVFSGASLIGGKSGTTPQLSLSVLRDYSSDLLVDPIDFTYLSTPASTPNVLVKVNGIQSVCLGDCSYTFLTNVPLLTAASRSGSVVTLTLTDPGQLQYTLSDVTISINGSPCTIITPTDPISSFTCQLPKNTDNSPVVEAGDYLPVATVKQVGQVGVDPSVNPLPFPLTLTSLNVTTGGTNGGLSLLLTGNGFPLNVKDAIVNICGQNVSVQSINNINAAILVPACPTAGPQDVKLYYGNLVTTSLVFNYVANIPSTFIYAISPKSYNPSLKGILEIWGAGFGTDSSLLRVDLANDTGKIYQMRILQSNDTYIKTGIPGGLPGQFRVEVNLRGVGEAFPNATGVNVFTYELVVNSISPTTGSYYGGTLIHLKGINFSPALDETLVSVGDEINSLCTIESVNTTDILCRTPAASPYYNISKPQGIILTNRLMVDNTCPNNICSFTYTAESSSPKLNSISTNTISSGAVTLTGSLFNVVSTQVILTNKLTAKQTIVIPSSISATAIVFNLPQIESGPYVVKARVDSLGGETNGLGLNVTQQASLSSLCSLKGCKVNITGHGLPASWPHKNYQLKILANTTFIDANVIASHPTFLTLAIPETAYGTSYKITLNSPINGDIGTYTFSSQSNYTAQIQLSVPISATALAGSITLNFTQTWPTSGGLQSIEIFSLYNSNEVISVTPLPTATTYVLFTISLTAGKYGFRFYYSSSKGEGLANCQSTLTVTTIAPTTTPQITSYAGGQIVISGSGLSKSGSLRINGFLTQLLDVTAIGARAIIPPYVNTLTQQTYSLVGPQKIRNNDFTIIADNTYAQALPFDGKHGSLYYSSASTCYIGIDVGSNLVLQLSRIRYFPNSRWMVVANYLVGGSFEGSNDGLTWTNIATIDSTTHSGWNLIQTDSLPTYRKFRFVHSTTSNCQLAELQFTGIRKAPNVASLTSNFANIVYEDGGNTLTIANQIEFREDHTPIVEKLSALNGHVFGGYDLTLTGKYLNFATPTVTIDGQPCVVSSSTSTSITCAVASRLTLPAYNSFIVKVGTSIAILKESFSYVLRWSDIRTWGTDLPPVDGDLVFVPAGMNLLVDQSTPNLKGILVQNGTLTFADESDITVNTGFITVVGGRFIAGTEIKPYTNKLTFILHGSYYGPQQPMFGNKGIGCLECYISIHGSVRSRTWTSIASTIPVGGTSLTVMDAVDWKVGEQIAVAASGFDHYESEQKTIASISGNIITVDTPFKYQHYSGIESYGSDKLEMRAEVGLLTRNIKIMGDETSRADSYGAHLMMAGSSQNGLVGRIAYTEFTECGQPKIIGRYCIHFHMNGDLSESYARGNAVHHSMARVVTLHGAHFLTVEHNVGYNVHGHNYFVEDGIQTNNLIQYNLAISSIQVWTMLQTDISVASFWITHPSNHFRYNHAAGSDFYGFWYEIKPNPDGPSACNDVCPMGNALGESRYNVAHSNARFGLRIFKLAPRTYPCSPIFVEDQIDPWKYNPGTPGTFANYTLYKNGESGLLAEQTGNLIFENITSAENGRAGAEFYVVEFMKDLTKFQNSVIIGQTQLNSPKDVSGSKGIITPRLGNIRINNIRFYNYPANTHSLQTCSKCELTALFTNSAQQIFISNITYTNVSGYKLFMNGQKKEIIYDLDGTFSTNSFDGTQRKSATIVNNYQHLASDPACKPTSNTQQWDTTIACDETVKVARITISALSPTTIFTGVGLKAEPIATVNDTVPETSTTFTETYSVFTPTNKMQPMISKKKSYSLPYIAGKIYNIWWLTGLDFDHLSMTSSHMLTSNDPAIIFKFNYTDNRQLYEVGPIRPGQPLTSSGLFVRNDLGLDINNCENGEFSHDNTAGYRTFSLCASSVNRTYFETTDVTAIYCRYLCPAPPGEFVKENFVRYWSNSSQWPEGRLPVAGENVTVNGNWTIIMDIDPAPCEFMTIDGDVIIEDIQDRHIECDTLWIRAGKVTAGSTALPFTHKLIFKINGYKNSSGYVFDPSLVGNKLFVITGTLSLIGASPSTLYSRLTSTVQVGATQLTVESASGWKVGDEIVIAPTFGSSRQYERVTITVINSNTITFTPPLGFVHYGAPTVTINNAFGTLDARATVGHVTRNIKFESGPDQGWGYSIISTQIWEGKHSRTGKVTLTGVEFGLGGQYDTEEATLILSNNMVNTGSNIVTRSSFSFCRSFCIKADFHSGATISDNVFYEGRKFHIKLSSVEAITATNNLMIGAISRPTFIGKEPIACLELVETDPFSSLSITNNICQGSDGNGFVLPFVPCDQIASIPYSQNTAGTAQVGFLLHGSGNGGCLAFSGAKAYACKVGQVSSPPNTIATKFSNFIMADNGRAVTLRFGLEGTDRSAYLTDSFITQISRPTCSECYGWGKIDCSNNYAVRMLVTTINGEHYPMGFDAGFDVICKHETLDCKAFLTNVNFDFYRQNYSEPVLSQCSNNIIFKPHDLASDITGSHHLWKSPCTNCEFDAFAHFDPPKLSELTWFGGCGNMTCTGKNNYVIHDHTGDLLSKPGVLLANNSWIGDNTAGCIYKPILNGYYCDREDFGVLEYESIAPDFNTRIMWPVSLNYEGGKWTTLTNGYKEWEWSGNEPLNKRLGRFISVVQLQQRYNMTFASNPPDDMRLQIQQRIPGGNSSDWIVVKIYYPFPNSIQVQVGGVTVRPIADVAGVPETALDTTVCGSNKFFYKNYTIHFVITGAADCMVRVTLTNSVQLTLRFAINIQDFFSSNGPTRLVDRMCAILQINDQSRVKIVGVYNGSSVVVAQIYSPPAALADSTVGIDQTASLNEVKAISAFLAGEYLNGNLESQLNLGKILSANTQVIPIRPEDENNPSSNDDSSTVIIASVVSVIAVLIIVGGVLLYLKKRQSGKVADEIPAYSSNTEPAEEEKPEFKKVQKDSNLQINNTDENISELHFERHA